jgi:hypothetical protein
MRITKCFLNIPQLERQRRIYRIISLERLYQLFDGVKPSNTLVKPHKWDDPFENFVLGMKGQMADGQTVEFGQRHDFYGQCWTLREETDAMWRIYSGDKKSVRIQVRIPNLVASLAHYSKGNVFIGKVRYLNTPELLAWAQTVMNRAKVPTIRLLAKTLLVKRVAFSHEQEVRLLYFDDRERDEIYRYRFPAHDLIEKIVLDPRLSDEEGEMLKQVIESRTGFNRKRIIRSKLYAAPPELVLRLGSAYTSMRLSSTRKSYQDGRCITLTRTRGQAPQLIFPFEQSR